MNGRRPITAGQARAAFLIALVADLLQLPLTLGSLSGVFSLPAEGVDLAIDVATGLLLIRLLGFHWALAPAFVLEVVPFVDLAPAWTACVVYVIAQRKREGRYLTGAP